MDIYDLIVIGTGTAAQTASERVREAGRTVAVIDHRPFGGTCGEIGHAIAPANPAMTDRESLNVRFGSDSALR
jgi:succinate dehydrogenase/fumarate reductase flavoprotein subunit